MMIKDFLLSKKKLITFWFGCIFFQHFISQLLLPTSIRTTIWHILWVIYTIWTVIILIYDIYKKNIHFKDKKILILSLFSLTNTISWILFNPSHTAYYIFTLVTLYAQCFIFYTYDNKNEIKDLFIKLAYVFVGIVSIYTTISLACYISGHTSFTLPNGTAITMLGDQTLAHNKLRFMGLWTWYTTASFNCYTAILLSLYLLDLNKNKIFHITMIILNTIMIYLTDSRSSLIILAFIFLCGILFIFKKKLSTKKILHIAIIAVVFSVLFFVLKLVSNSELLSMLMSDPYNVLNDLSSLRLNMHVGIIRHMKDSWLLGYGYCNNDFVVSTYSIPHPHNVFMATLLYSGIVGLTLFIIFIILNIQSVIKNIKTIFSSNLRWILVLVMSIFIESLFDICIIGAPLNIETLYFWLCLGMITSHEKNIN